MYEPPFCANPCCQFHDPQIVRNTAAPFCRRIGWYATNVAGNIQRFRCRGCGKTFSERTFRLDYYTKRAVQYQELLRELSSGESLSAMARRHHCSPACVQNRLERLSRNALLFHSRCLTTLKLTEDLTADGFESFEVSQFHPNNINLLVGKDSQFLYGFTHYTLRRKGRMTEAQKARRARLETRYKPPRGAALTAFVDLVSGIPDLWDRTRRPTLALFTDKHQAYQ